ncbi:DUF971 domain-containing protein [Burkholderia multivorans]|uniref:gamma-butyrobetaine hydroxylase-like domain-containing protein n=1 Tax=Burkholderia multivorans TaxID=87883 RepID=UPI001C21DCE3|nr:gamma-butyrobetaine hydroxylase-like domain-containing protein [Burkholderia multivorans]MBU9263441.1 DUF971 domain-containing protein [Burkholderia multivorans]
MTAPTELVLDHAARALTLRWADGGTQRIDYARLRRACPCAACRALRRRGMVIGAPADVTLAGVEPVGYGICVAFGDGHARGIYPWTYLAELRDDGENAPIDASCADV